MIVITGTDTGVGKTLLTGLLLSYLRQRRIQVLALKPFCSGSRADAQLIYRLQDAEWSLAEINPFFFREPVAPAVAARKAGRSVCLDDVLSYIRVMQQKLASRAVTRRSVAGRSVPASAPGGQDPRRLLIEGAGGLLVPLGEGFTLLDIIRHFQAQVIIVARNKLGVINHTLLTVRALQVAGVKNHKVVLMNSKTRDASCAANPTILKEILTPSGVLVLPFLGPQASGLENVKRGSRRLKEILAQLL